MLLFDKGLSIAPIAEVLLVSEDAIRKQISEYGESKKLKPENVYREVLHQTIRAMVIASHPPDSIF